jgi:hypothetical protein
MNLINLLTLFSYKVDVFQWNYNSNDNNQLKFTRTKIIVKKEGLKTFYVCLSLACVIEMIVLGYSN